MIITLFLSVTEALHREEISADGMVGHLEQQIDLQAKPRLNERIAPVVLLEPSMFCIKNDPLSEGGPVMTEKGVPLPIGARIKSIKYGSMKLLSAMVLDSSSSPTITH